MIPSHHSLVTPIDWKRRIEHHPRRLVANCHHSLVTPIDWKLVLDRGTKLHGFHCHQSLVTPIDWKRELALQGGEKMLLLSPLAGDTY